MTFETGFVHVRRTDLFRRAIGAGEPLFILHGGPEFDHTYLLPSMDQIAPIRRLIYYDQRGRGRSQGEVEDVTLESEILDLDELRQHFRYERIALLGHSWGAILAMKYAIRFSSRVTHLVLVNPASCTYGDIADARQRRAASLEPCKAELAAIRESQEFIAGDPSTVSRYLGVLFRRATRDPRHSAQLDFRLEQFTREGVVKARAIDERLLAETFNDPAFDMTQELQRIKAPTLVIHGENDFFQASGSSRIADSIPGAQMVTIPNCGHFSYLESPEAFRLAVEEFVSSPGG